MNLEKVVFGFVIVLALTLNVAFVLGGSDANPEQHNIWILFAAVAVNLVATALKLGDRSQVGALLPATALVADLQLLASTLIWTFADDAATGLAAGTMVSIVSLAAGALIANVVSVTLVVSDTLLSSR
ncbi:MAG: DUF6394 family protein [Pseudomonadales bacterium]